MPMPQQSINLNTLLSWFSMPDNKMKAKVREAARSYINKQQGLNSGGGDFHMPFWRDAKHHLAGTADLREATQLRISENKRRERLYNLLTDNFLRWWGEKKRWTNEGVSFAYVPVKGTYEIPEYNAIVKVHNSLTIQIGGQPLKSFYPYFTEDPALSDDIAKIGLWVMTQAIPEVPDEQLRILDVLRFKSYSQKKHPLVGNEEERFLGLYTQVNRYWEGFCTEFDEAA